MSNLTSPSLLKAGISTYVPAFKPLPKTNQFVGIDLGITDFAILSNGRKVDNQRFTAKMEQKLKREQRKLSRRYAQELMPDKIGLMSGLTVGLAFGMGALGSVIIGILMDNVGIMLTMQIVSFLPILGLVCCFMPNDRKTA